MPEVNNQRDEPSLSAVSHSRKHGGRAIESPVLSFDLHTELEQLRRQARYQQGSPSGRTLVKTRDLRIVLMALKTGGRMSEHHASGPLSIQVMEGCLQVGMPDASIELTAGMLLALESDIPHDLEASADSAFLLTIGRTSYEQVSDLHEPER